MKAAEKPMSAEKLIAELEEGLRLKERNRLEHPFVLAVARGEATKNQIAGWVNQLRLWADPSNKLLGILYATCPEDDLREAILENILEEEKGDTSGAGGHMRLVERTLEELGWTEDVRNLDTLRVESWALRHWLEVVIRNRPFVEGICAVSFAMERLNPFVFGKIYDGLKTHYDLSEEAMASIAVHASHVEAEHGTLGPTAIQRYATSAVEQDAVRFAVLHTGELYYAQYNVWRYY